MDNLGEHIGVDESTRVQFMSESDGGKSVLEWAGVMEERKSNLLCVC